MPEENRTENTPPEWIDPGNASAPIKNCPYCGHDKTVMQDALAEAIKSGKAPAGSPVNFFQFTQAVYQPASPLMLSMGPTQVPAKLILFDICLKCTGIIVMAIADATAIMAPAGAPPGAQNQPKFPFKGN